MAYLRKMRAEHRRALRQFRFGISYFPNLESGIRWVGKYYEKIVDAGLDQDIRREVLTGFVNVEGYLQVFGLDGKIRSDWS